VREIWTRIEAWLRAQVPSGADVLSPVAAEEEIAATERFLGVSFPEDVRASFRLHDGQAGGPWPVWGCELLSLGRIREEWTAWKELLDRGMFENSRSCSDGRVVEDWWHAGWVPLTHDGSGNHYCLDLNPGPTGRAGQIIQMWHDDPGRPVVAPSYRAWLAAFADALEAGEYVYSKQYVGLVPREDAECHPAQQQAAAGPLPGVEAKTQGDTGDVARATFRLRRRRQVLLLLFGLPFIAVLGFKGLLGWLGGAVAVVLIFLTLGYVTFAVIFSLRNWRCPRCNRWLGNQLNPPSCAGCGVRFGP
jgi:cell wall assembly regulator SMI1